MHGKSSLSYFAVRGMRRTRTVDKCSAQNDDAGKERGCEEGKKRKGAPNFVG